MRNLNNPKDMEGFADLCYDRIGEEFETLSDERAVKRVKNFTQTKLAKYGFYLCKKQGFLLWFDFDNETDRKIMQGLYEKNVVSASAMRNLELFMEDKGDVE